jgi:hypothetical protein
MKSPMILKVGDLKLATLVRSLQQRVVNLVESIWQ